MVSSAFRATAVPFVAGVLLLAPASTVPQARPAALDDAAIVHVLDRTGFGARAEDVARVREVGLDRYLDEQLHPERLSDADVRARLGGFQTLALDSSAIAERYYAPLLRERRASKKDDAGKPADAADARADMDPAERARRRELREAVRVPMDELGEQKILRAVYSPRQLEEVLVDFWFNHFNVFAGKGPVRTYLTEYERDAIRPHVLGRFRDLLGAVARSPAMLFYLDNWQSVDPQAAEDMTRRLDRVGEGSGARGEGVRGRIARRRLEQRLGAKATPDAIAQIKQRMPRGLNENYARELMELHTLGVAGGYTQADVVEVARAFTGWTIRGPRQGGAYAFDARRHAKGPKTVLGTTIDAGGERDGEAVLDLLAAHPSTATFIATKLARRFVADEPPPALVKRAAATFTSSRGDLRAVVRTILTSPEFLGVEARRAKVKTPFEFAVSALRATRAEVADASAVVQQVRTLGMPLYFAQPPTGYADTADAWVNAGALVNRMNFAIDLTANRVSGVRVDLAALTGTTDVERARTWAIAHLLRGQASDATSSTLARGADLSSIAALSLGSPEFQRR
ncbi:MAG: DUF1800 domain-containing protein [Vicinamibacteria bacterium]